MKSRNALIAKIKIAQKELGMADEAYRAMLLRVTGKNSCAAMDTGELEAVLAEMVWRVPELIADLSRYERLGPGDLIMTGTPAGVGAVVAGEAVDRVPLRHLRPRAGAAARRRARSR